MIDKLTINYAVKGNAFEYKEVDDSARTIDLVANTYLYFDSDCDVLVPGCAKKSIKERGPNSTEAGKIKHLKGHNLSDMIAVPTFISEEKVNGNEVLRCNSYFPESEDSENELINYKSGMYDQHSIGFRYLNIQLADKKSVNEDNRKLWDEYIQKIINPKDAEKVGVMFIVKEIGLYEYSTVAFGANRLTPYLGSKSENKQVRYNNLEMKLDAMLKSDVEKYVKDIQVRQFKQMLYEIMTEEPGEKSLIKPIVAPVQMLDSEQSKQLINNFKFF